jgi:hypothetical protein
MDVTLVLAPAKTDDIKATGSRVIISIDESSVEAAQAGLRALVQDGVVPEAMMVITPETSRFMFRTVSWLWSEGVRRVRADLSLESDWSAAAKDDLHEELAAVGRQLIWHQLRGEDVIFQPFEEPPPASRWFSRLCADIGDATEAALADVQREGAEILVPIAVP